MKNRFFNEYVHDMRIVTARAIFELESFLCQFAEKIIMSENPENDENDGLPQPVEEPAEVPSWEEVEEIPAPAPAEAPVEAPAGDEPMQEPSEEPEEELSSEEEAEGASAEGGAEEANFQKERETLTWDAALKFAEEFEEDASALVSTKEREMYARQALLKGWKQDVLKKSRILVAGLGRLGRELVKNLALIGVGHMTLVDPATIEPGNAPGFMIPQVQETTPKVELVKEHLSHLNPFMETETYANMIEDVPLRLFKEHEIIVGCMNTFKSRSYMQEVCKRSSLPYAEASILGMEGFVQVWLPADEDAEEKEDYFSPCFADEIDAGRDTNAEAVASVLAGVLGQEIIKIAFKAQNGDIGEVQKPRYIRYDGSSGIFDTVPEHKDLLLLKDKQYNFDAEALKRSNVFIAGVGALGCEIAKDLALSGVGKLVLVDLDTIEASNLSRQLLFRMDDIGKPKAEVAAERVKELNPNLEVEFYFKKIQELPIDLYESCDVIIAALDNVQARFDLNVIARRAKRPMIEGGTVGFEGHVQVIVPDGVKSLDETACYRCVVPIPPPDKRLIAACTPKGIPQNREHCVLRAEFIFRKELEREADLKNAQDLILLTGASNKELQMLQEREAGKDFGGPFVPQDMENILENKIPAIQTVSAVIASLESVEAMKMACTQNAETKPEAYHLMDPTYLNYNGMYGIVDHLPVLKREDCIVCGTQKGIDFVQIPITEDSTIEDIFTSLVKIGTITEDQKFMMTNPVTKGFLYHPSNASYGDKTKLLSDLGLAPGNDVLLTPFGVPMNEDGSEPTKLQVTLVSVS